jgi:hypothetical protein
MLEMWELDADDVDGDLFQQDGATAHTARDSTDCERAVISGRVISHFGDIAWSASSPNLSAPCHFLWEQLVSKVRLNKPGTLEELREHIGYGIRATDTGLLHAVMVKLRSRLQEYIACKRYHLGNVIF